jgi:hypothetical protein
MKVSIFLDNLEDAASVKIEENKFFKTNQLNGLFEKKLSGWALTNKMTFFCETMFKFQQFLCFTTYYLSLPNFQAIFTRLSG